MIDRAELISRIEGIRRLLAGPMISENFRRNAVADRICIVYEDVVGPGRLVMAMSIGSFALAIENTTSTSEAVADRLLEAAR